MLRNFISYISKENVCLSDYLFLSTSPTPHPPFLPFTHISIVHAALAESCLKYRDNMSLTYTSSLWHRKSAPPSHSHSFWNMSSWYCRKHETVITSWFRIDAVSTFTKLGTNITPKPKLSHYYYQYTVIDCEVWT